MKMVEKNYNQNDYQTMVIQKEKADELIKNYESFGWFPIAINQSSQYENLVEVEFCRNHFIKNKDELQFLQVNMEHDINAKGKLERTKHSKTLIWSLSMGMFACYCIISAIFCVLRLNLTLGIILCCLFSVLALLTIILVPIIMVKNVKKEKLIFNKKVKEYNEQIIEFCNKAKTLIEVSDE